MNIYHRCNTFDCHSHMYIILCLYVCITLSIKPTNNGNLMSNEMIWLSSNSIQYSNTDTSL